MGSILLSTLATNLVTGVITSPNIPEPLKPGIAQSMQTQTSNIEFGSSVTTAQNDMPSVLGAEITSIAHAATVEASRLTLLSGIIFMVLAFFLTLRLPNTKMLTASEQKPASAH